tara:strand:+ start:1600 stop:2295 length:696 start_codon:yes stop_codon:yes gene_type:complete
MKSLKKKGLLAILILITIIWILYFLNKDFFQLETLFNNIDNIKYYISNNYFFSILIFTLFYSILILCNFPMASLLSMISGFLFGTLVGGLLALIGGTIGAFSIFIIAKFFLLDFIRKNLLNRYSFIVNYFNKNDLELMLLIRLIPAVPFFAQNLILAGLGAKNKKFFFTTLIGLTPWSFIFGSVGQGLEEIFISNTDISLSLIAEPKYFLPLGLMISMIILIFLYKKKLKK